MGVKKTITRIPIVNINGNQFENIFYLVEVNQLVDIYPDGHKFYYENKEYGIPTTMMPVDTNGIQHEFYYQEVVAAAQNAYNAFTEANFNIKALYLHVKEIRLYIDIKQK